MPNPPTIEELLEHEAFLRRLAQVLVRDEAAAEDLVQDTWVEALSCPPRKRINLRSWLAIVARRLSYRRTIRTVSPAEISWSQGRPIHHAPPEEELERTAIARVVSDHLLSLGEPYKGVLLQRFYEGLTPLEIARKTETSVNTVNSRLRRGLVLLRQRLDRSAWRGRWEAGFLVFVGPAGPRQVADVLPGIRSLSPLWTRGACIGLVSMLGLVFLWHSQPARTSSEATARNASAVEMESEVELHSVPTREGRSVVRRGPAPPKEGVPTAAATGGTASAGALPVLVLGPDETAIAGADVFMIGLGIVKSGTRGVQKIRRAGTTDRDGKLRVRFVPGDIGMNHERQSIALWAEAPGHIRSPVTFLPVAGAEERQLPLRVGGPDEEIRGVVLAGSSPVARAQITVGPGGGIEFDGDLTYWRQPALGWTNSDGSFVIRGVGPGRKRIVARAPGFSHFETWSDSLGEDGNVVIHLEPGCSIVGTVRSPDGDPLSGVVLSIEGDPDRPGWAALSDDMGRFRIDSIPPGPRHCGAYTEDLSQVAWSLLDLKPGATRVWEPVVRPARPLEIRLFAEDGVPLLHHGVIVVLDSPASWSRQMDSMGSNLHRLVALPQGQFRVLIYRSLEALSNERDQPHFSVAFDESRGSGSFDVRVLSEPTSLVTLRADVRDASGGVPQAMRLHLIHGSAIISREGPIDETTGMVHLAQIVPGHYLVGVSGHRKGTAVLRDYLIDGPGIEDLETLRIPETGALSLAWPYPEGTVLELAQELMGRRLVLDRVSSSAQYELFPGTYHLRVRFADGRRQEENLAIGSGDEVIWPFGSRAPALR